MYVTIIYRCNRLLNIVELPKNWVLFRFKVWYGRTLQYLLFIEDPLIKINVAEKT